MSYSVRRTCPFIQHLLHYISDCCLIIRPPLKILLQVIILFYLIYPLNVFGQGDKNPGVSLYLAVLQDNRDAVRQLLEGGADLNEKDQFGSTPLIIAATFGRTEIAKTLVDADADLNIQSNEGSTALHVAAFLGRTDIVKLLLDKGADRVVRNNFGSTAYDIVAVPFSVDKELYDGLSESLKPVGFVLDYNKIKLSRSEIAELLRPRQEDLVNIDYTPAEGPGWKTSTPSEQGIDPVLVAELYQDAGNMENIYGLLLIKNGCLIAEDYFNEGSITQKARLQSVTKSFTSALVGIAIDRGYISDPDQKMADFFPELKDQISDKRKEQITIREMLQMRAGYPWEEMNKELFNILYAGFKPHYLIDFPLTNNPGEGFQYSNLTSHLLGIITAKACKKDLMTFARENLFDKMNIEPGEWIRDWEGYYNGHADLHITARDMAKFGLLYLNKGKYDGKQIISSDWVDASLQNYSDFAWTTKDSINYAGRYFRDLGYGYQWWSAVVGGHRYSFAWGHGGQFIVLLDDLDMVIVVTSYPFPEQHEYSWKQERVNFNLVGKFIQLLRKES